MTEARESETVLPPDEAKLRVIAQATMVDQELMTTRSSFRRAALTIRRQFLPYFFARPPKWRVRLRAKSKETRLVPEFVAMGAVRSGTTSLADYVLQHPCVLLPLSKELPYRTRMRLLAAQFPSVSDKNKAEKKYGKALTGFFTPVIPSMTFPYFFSALTTKAKVIVLLRNPVDRTFAHWRWDQALSRGLQNDPIWENYPDFDALINLELSASKFGAGPGMSFSGTGVGGYIQHSIYQPFLEAVFQFFDREKTMFIASEDYFNDPVGTAKNIYKFLELPAFEPKVLKVKNAGPKMDLNPETRQKLVDFFEPLNQKLYEFIGRDLGWR